MFFSWWIFPVFVIGKDFFSRRFPLGFSTGRKKKQHEKVFVQEAWEARHSSGVGTQDSYETRPYDIARPGTGPSPPSKGLITMLNRPSVIRRYLS